MKFESIKYKLRCLPSRKVVEDYYISEVANALLRLEVKVAINIV